MKSEICFLCALWILKQRGDLSLIDFDGVQRKEDVAYAAVGLRGEFFFRFLNTKSHFEYLLRTEIMSVALSQVRIINSLSEVSGGEIERGREKAKEPSNINFSDKRKRET